jgi:Fic family protein
MLNLADKLQHIDSLRKMIESKGKLSDDILRKIDYKFRLECNYNSNKIEGGTLTKPETRSVMTGNITVEGKPLKDIREMKGHDAVMQDLLRIGKGEKRISEKKILEFHSKIIKGETPEEEKEMEIGQWKTNGNHVINYRGEKFNFTAPEDISTAIHNLLNWLNTGLDKIHNNHKDAPNPLLLAFEFHTKYLTIHPFADGNGRTARLLTNLVLVSLGYPPFWVTEGGEKDAYNRYLADVQAYGGSPDLLYEFLAGLVERSLQLTLDAVEGREIEDLDDWAKKLQLLKTSLPSEDALKVARDEVVTNYVYHDSIKVAISNLMEKLSSFDELFLKKNMIISSAATHFSVKSTEELMNRTPAFNNQTSEELVFMYDLQGYKKEEGNPFSILCRVRWKLETYFYTCSIDHVAEQPFLLRRYDEFYTPDEINIIVSKCGEVLFQQLEAKIKS